MRALLDFLFLVDHHSQRLIYLLGRLSQASLFIRSLKTNYQRNFQKFSDDR
jgi:hypothetical protein